MSNHFVWVTCRASGLAALVLLSATVGVGVLFSARLARRVGGDLRVLHEALSLATYAMLALHGLSLLLDRYFHPSLWDLTVPFLRDFRAPYQAIGIISGWGTLIFGLSYYARTRIGSARWRMLHRLTLVFWALSVVHTLGEGSDAGAAWFIAVVAVTVAPAAVLTLARLLQVLGQAPSRLPAATRDAP